MWYEFSALQEMSLVLKTLGWSVDLEELSAQQWLVVFQGAKLQNSVNSLLKLSHVHIRNNSHHVLSYYTKTLGTISHFPPQQFCKVHVTIPISQNRKLSLGYQKTVYGTGAQQSRKQTESRGSKAHASPKLTLLSVTSLAGTLF